MDGVRGRGKGGKKEDRSEGGQKGDFTQINRTWFV